MAVIDIKKSASKQAQEPRRGADPGDSAYLKLVGRRVRAQRTKLGMSRKALSTNSGVSERYLAELERGSGNASLLVLRKVASALGLMVNDLSNEQIDPLADNDINAHNEPLERIGKIVLIGLRGAGKSTLGRAAAARFNVPFVELNTEVERVAGMELSEIFAERGESGFRALELSCLNAILEAHEDVIVATGGGIVTDWQAFQQVASNSFVVWAKTSAEVLFDRARNSIALREAGMSHQAMTEIRDFIATRAPMFAKADATINTTDKESVDTIVELVQILSNRKHAA